ncbi:MAG: HDOD domain-containing protein [Chitinispirillaceae bacterium]|nr:HDOD domain-containing protein [Chitinispirillaceae bacterium]
MKDQIIEQHLSGIDNIPTLPLVLQQIRKVVSNSKSNMAQIASIVSKDQALASRTIRLVNSAYYARSTRVTTIQQAIVILGLNTLNNLMLGLTVIKIFDNTKSILFDHNAFWKHCFGTALLSKKIAEVTHCGGDKEECFIAGLLHDMGRLVMEQFMHDTYIKALQKSQESKSPLIGKELETFGFTHSDAGSWLGRRWNIPLSLIYSMEFHHLSNYPSSATQTEKDIIRIVTAANELCNIAQIGSSGENKLTTNATITFSSLTKEVCKRIIEETAKEVDSTLNEWKKCSE